MKYFTRRTTPLIAVLGILLGANNAVSAEVIFKAFDSKGQDTKTCLTQKPFGYRLAACDDSDSQTFTFDVNGAGGTIRKGNQCASVLNRFNPWKTGFLRSVAKQNCDKTGTQIGVTSNSWRYTNGDQIVATESPNQNVCLTALRGSIILGDCSKRETLTSWGVLVK